MEELDSSRFSAARFTDNLVLCRRPMPVGMVAAGPVIWIVRMPEALPGCARSSRFSTQDELLSHPLLTALDPIQ